MDKDNKATLDILSDIGLGKEEEEYSFGLVNEGPEHEGNKNPNEGSMNPPETAPEKAEEVPPTPNPNPSAFGVVAGTTHVLVQSNKEHEPLRLGSTFFITETKTLLGHVEDIVGNGQYIIRLDSLAVQNTQGMHVSLGSSENIEEDKAKSNRGKRKVEESQSSRKKPHDSAPVSAAFSTGSSVRGGQQNINHSLPQFPGVSEGYVNWYRERLFGRRPAIQRGGPSGSAVNQSSINQQQHFGSPHALLNPYANPNQQQMQSQTQSQGFNAGQSFHQGGAIRPGGTLESAVYQNYVDQLHYLQNTAPRPEAYTSQVFPHPNQQMRPSGQISTILQGGWSGSYGVDQNYSNQQHSALSQPRPALNFNPETQPMQSQVFHAGPSSYRGRGAHRSRARGRGRRGRD